jgi:hypothetical protein
VIDHAEIARAWRKREGVGHRGFWWPLGVSALDGRAYESGAKKMPKSVRAAIELAGIAWLSGVPVWKQ